MLTYADLVILEPALRGSRVLSVYVDGIVSDPARRHDWRLVLERSLDALGERIALGASAAEREDFDACRRVLAGELQSLENGVGAPGWVAFVAPEGVWYAKAVPIRVPTLALWGRGASVGPYVRALGENPPALVVVVDSRRAALYRHRYGRLDRIYETRAHHASAPLAEHIQATVADDEWIVIGGIPQAASQLASHLTHCGPRVLTLSALDAHASTGDIVSAARAGASMLVDAWHAREIDELIEQAESGSLGVLGPLATQRALDLACVRELYLTPHFLEQHPAGAADTLRRAFDQNVRVETVSSHVAAPLDRFGGVAARLHYRPAGLARPIPPRSGRSSLAGARRG